MGWWVLCIFYGMVGIMVWWVLYYGMVGIMVIAGYYGLAFIPFLPKTYIGPTYLLTKKEYITIQLISTAQKQLLCFQTHQQI